MTPQLRQAINLLQMSNLELNELVSKELETNPLLEREDERLNENEPRQQTIDDYDTPPAETEDTSPTLTTTITLMTISAAIAKDTAYLPMLIGKITAPIILPTRTTVLTTLNRSLPRVNRSMPFLTNKYNSTSIHPEKE